MKWFRGVLVFKAHRLVYHSTLGLRVIKKKKKKKMVYNPHPPIPNPLQALRTAGGCAVVLIARGEHVLARPAKVRLRDRDLISQGAFRSPVNLHDLKHFYLKAKDLTALYMSCSLPGFSRTSDQSSVAC